jgi:predicted phage terminase large subunit-like protein
LAAASPCRASTDILSWSLNPSSFGNGWVTGVRPFGNFERLIASRLAAATRTIFGSNTRIKYGQAAMKKWALEGNTQANYLATSPTGTATGFGANDIVLDDIMNAQEAFDEAVLEKQWNWLTNTMLSRTEGDDWKVYAIMTRWAQGDLAGRIIEAFGDLVEVITFKAVQDDGSMLCDSVLNRGEYDLKTQEMAAEIVEANYNQRPIDVKGRLFSEFGVWDTLPQGQHKRWNYTDTADKGTDFLCSVAYIEHESDVYVTDLVMSDEAMETTEPAVADMLQADQVDEAEFESNNGGRGFARNVERILKERGTTRTVIRDKPETANKEARILSSSAWVNKHVFMPQNWSHKYPEFYRQLMSYQKKGKTSTMTRRTCLRPSMNAWRTPRVASESHVF